MKIVMINGSPRKNGATARILKKMQEKLEHKPDVSISYYHLDEYSLLDCSGCLSCYSRGTCHLKDDLESINTKVAESDALIIGSPVYVSNVPGTLKRYIDRGHFVLEQSLHGKYTYAVTTYEIGGSSDVISILNKLFRISGGISLGNMQIKLPFNSNPFELPKLEDQIEKTANKIYKAIASRKRKKWFDKLFNGIAIHRVIKPYVITKSKQYKAVIERWQNLKIIKNV
jgi:multimeric flavodoxin WrbA